ncbi:MAG: tetratricopeptide repeat protein, partial [Chitinophagales bacterium]
MKEVTECKEDLEQLLPAQTTLIAKTKNKLRLAEEKLLNFIKRVIFIYGTIERVPVNTARSIQARGLFEAGRLDEAIAVLSTPEMDIELIHVKESRDHLKRALEEATEKARLIAHDFLSRALYQSAKPSTPDLVKQTIESFEKSLEAMELYDNLFQYSLYLKLIGRGSHTVSYLGKALAFHIAENGEDNEDNAMLYNSLAMAWKDKGDLDKAISYLDKALAIDLKLFGDESPNLARDYNNLALAWQDKGDLDKAISYLDKTLAISLKLFGEENSSVAIAYNNLGLSWQGKGNLDNAISSYNKALPIFLKLFGEENPNIATGYNNLGMAWQAKGDLVKA